MNIYEIYKTDNGYMSEFICMGCGKKFQIVSESEPKLRQIMSKKKYCEICARESIRKSNCNNRKKIKRTHVIDNTIGIREFNEGYKRFWEKRGYKPPAVNQYVLEKL